MTNADSTFSAGRSLTIATASAILVSAFLLFSVQPLFARMALPLLGGASNVWNTAMVFFQATLLLGYLYAHFLQRHLSLAMQVGIHMIVLCVATLVLPIAIPKSLTTVTADAPTIRLLMIFALGAGAPFFALSASAPLLQRWFSISGHPGADDPYHLYAASNIGSMAALLSYPVIIEPMFAVSAQTELWHIGFLTLIPIIFAAGLLTMRSSPKYHRSKTETAILRPINNRSRLRIVGLSFVPSGLMLAVTTHLTTDIASMPLLWIAPFSLYLLTFIVTFSTKDRPRSKFLRRYTPLILIMAALFGVGAGGSPLIIAPTELFAFFLIALVCHRQLVDERPETKSLTEFYIWMSVGGVLGGLFAGIISPLIFDDIWEYPLLLILSAWLVIRPSLVRPSSSIQIRIRYALLLAGAASILFGPISQILATNDMARILVNIALIAGAAIFIYTERHNKSGFAAGFAAFVMILYASAPALLYRGDDTILRARSFFGSVKVTEGHTQIGAHHALIHGTTIHNYQIREQSARKAPLAYYGANGPFGETIAALREHRRAAGREGTLRIAAIGLGAGAIACHNKPGDEWVFFEIDPLIVEIAQDDRYFSYLSDCAPGAEIRTGDARLVIRSDKSLIDFDLLIVDAFSSDSIAAHLITREAIKLYRDRIKDDGVILLHTSNRTLDMTSVAIATAEASGEKSRVMRYMPDPANPHASLLMPSHAVAMSQEAVINTLFADYPRWQKEEANPIVGVWTDDYSHIVGAFFANKFRPRTEKTD
ncbi:MAG: fused MFS/spermidine synthase [Marinicaulis sp.]|nr:fused MFS/spermidine synthase [Marinicaulis sp.]NNL87973.1 fused MFS/spermidine synthase [Marinicaulis sp.]